MSVVIRGGGIAPACLRHLLREGGVEAELEPSPRSGVPALLVGARTQGLVKDLFRGADLFVGLPRIDWRIVQWGEKDKPTRVPHNAVSVTETELRERLHSHASQQPVRLATEEWTLFTSAPLPSLGVQHCFGRRTATVAPVRFSDRAERSACWIESLEDGWLFALPGAERKGWLIAVGAPQETLLSQSRLVSARISAIGDVEGPFPAFPAISDPLCGPGWLACGRAAMAFDPLCGDGTGNAIRGSILASAVVRAALAGQDQSKEQEEFRAHFSARLISGFLKHLEICRPFYVTGGTGPWWRAELELLDQGIEFCRQRLRESRPARFRLAGADLVRL